MISSVLRSKRAVQVTIEIMRIFVWLFLNPVNDLNGAPVLSEGKSKESVWNVSNDWNGLRSYYAFILVLNSGFPCQSAFGPIYRVIVNSSFVIMARKR